jgi:histidine triad (HIT) family protein
MTVPISYQLSVVMPKAHYESLFDLDKDLAGGYLGIIQKVGLHICAKLGCHDFNVVNANGRWAQQSVFHIHFHIVPRFENDGLNLWFHGRQKPSREELESLGRLLKF